MRKAIAALLVLMLLTGCGGGKTVDAPVPEKGDFTFTLPEGYTLGDITDTESTVFDSEGTPVGGIRLAQIPLNRYLDRDSPAIPYYLDTTAEGSEYFSWIGGDDDAPIHYIDQQFTDADTQQRRFFSRILFVKDGAVYDIWFDTALISSEEIARFHPIAEDN